MKRTAVILNMGATGLGVTRSLGIEDIDVIGVDYNSSAVGFSSKHCKRKIILKTKKTSTKNSLEQLIGIGKEFENKPVLIPTSDYFLSLISENRKALAEYFLFNIPNKNTFDLLEDKRKQYQSVASANIPYPKTFSPKTIEQLIELKSTLNFPLIIKGAVSHKWQNKFRIKAIMVNNFEDLKHEFKKVLEKDVETVIQEIVIGPNKNHFKVCAYYSFKQELLGIFSTNKQRQYPIDFGVGTYMVSKNMPELIETAKMYFNRLGYTGMGSIEFKLDDRDNKFKFIELNPRFWQQNYHSTIAGVNFALTNYCDCIGETIVPQLNFKENVRWVDFKQDLRSFKDNYKLGNIKFFEWFKSIHKIESQSYYSMRDFKPAFSFLGKNIKAVIEVFKLKIK